MSDKGRPSSAGRANRPGSGRPGSGSRNAPGSASRDNPPCSERPGSARKKQENPGSSEKHAAFDFSDGKTAKSLAEYIVLLDTDLLPQLIKEEDSEKRQKMGHAIRRKITDVNTAIRARQLAKDQTRRDILKLTGQQHQHAAFSGDLLQKGGIDAWLKHETQSDEAVYEGVRQYLHSQEVENKMLRETLDRRRNLEETLAPKPADRAIERRGSVIDRMNLLEGIIKKQDSDISVLQNQIQEQNTKYVLLPKEDYLEIDRKIQPFLVRRRSARGSRSESVQAVTMATDMRASICNLVEQVEKLRGRVQQTSDTITDQEKDKEVSLKILQEENQTAEELREVIVRKVNEWEEEKENMQGEITSLRNNIASLAAQNRSLMDALAKNEQAENDRKESARLRRISCPQPTPRTAEEGIKKAAEKRQRRVTVVGNAPKLASVQLSLGSAGMRVRKSSAPSQHGPMKASGYP